MNTIWEDPSRYYSKEKNEHTFDLIEYQDRARDIYSPKRLFELWEDVCKKYDRGFIGKYALAVPLISDEDGAISNAFGTWVEKSMYGRKYMGMERATYLIGADGRLLKAWRKVKVPGHAEEVLKAVL